MFSIWYIVMSCYLVRRQDLMKVLVDGQDFVNIKEEKILEQEVTCE